MSLKAIIEYFALVSGLEMKDISRYLPVLTDCREFFEERLHPGLTESQLRRAAHACAVYAFYQISRISDCGEPDSVKVGDVQVQKNADSCSAERLWQDMRESISDIADIGGDVAFRGVRV